MKRWYVKFHDGMTLRLYYPSEEKIRELYPDCQEIKECLEVGYLDYIDKILKLSIAQRNDFKGRMIHKIPYNSGYIDVRFGYDNQDCTYYDFLEYQRHTSGDMKEPILWTWSTPQEFYDTFLCDIDKDRESIRLAYKELTKIKPKVTKFYNKNGMALWLDQYGYIYYADKSDLPNKHNKTEWEEFHDNKNAVLMFYTSPPYGDFNYKWFKSIDEFYSFFQDMSQKSNITLNYEVKRVGYKFLHPQDRKNIFRLPYFNIDKEIKAIDQSHGSSIKYNKLAREWAKMCEPYKWFGSWYDQIDFLENVIRYYIEWVDKK